ncbi:hypothetical protein SFC43_05480 [Bacteroides sp. CR5/BHMF/2]|nr:hypothetical protein [Bacteroides sp. CR5/BHMF/2]
MITIFAILMLLYNMWLVFYLVMERRQPQEKAPSEEEKPKPVEKVEDNGIVGKSYFKMPQSATNCARYCNSGRR